MRFFRRISKSKLYTCLWLIFFTIFTLYIEVFSYYLNTFNWNKLKCERKENCTTILLVADPQIIGNSKEILHFLTPLAIFDSDRYLTKTYSYAYDFVQPDVVIFLGDLMDEAHIATDKEFHQYVRRVFNIFLQKYDSSHYVRHIWLPGDNDIGGEDTAVTPKKLKRFEHAFHQPDIISIKNNNFFKINRLSSLIPVFKKKRDFFDTNQLFIGLSHVPLMFKPAPFVSKVLEKMMPQLLFTAHEHKSMIISTDALLRENYHIVPVTPDNNQIYEYSLGASDMYEIMVPTCSYRMGTVKIGYGYAILEDTELKFTVLWTPSRFHQLAAYLIFACCFIFVTILAWYCNFIFRSRL